MKDRRGIRIEEGQKVAFGQDCLPKVCEGLVVKVNALAQPHPAFPNGVKSIEVVVTTRFAIPLEIDQLQDIIVLPPKPDDEKKLVAV